MLLVRDVQKTDLPGLKRLAAVLNSLNLPNNEEVLENLIDRSVRSFSGKLKEPFEREYLFVLEDAKQGFARCGVGRHTGLDDDCVRTQPSCSGASHRSVDAVRLRFVAGGKDHARPDDHGSAAQPRVVPLLDGREECVHVGVEDGCLNTCEHMFACLG